MRMLEGHAQSLAFGDTAVTAGVAIEALVAHYARLLFRVAHSVLRDRAEAEDAVQETFVRVLRKREQLPDVQDMRVWLVRVTWNIAVDRRRKLKPQQALDDAFVATLLSLDQPADEVLSDRRRLGVVMEELERLPEKEKQVLLLAAQEEMTMAEIAAVVGRSESAVRALVFRARARLKERVAEKEARR